MQAFKHRLRFTIGTKLVGLVAALLMGSVVSLVWLSTRMFVESDTALIQQANADSAANLATQMRELLQGITDKMRILGTILLQAPNPPELKGKLAAEFFSKDKDFLAVFLEKADASGRFVLMDRALSLDMKNLNDPNGDRAIQAFLQDPDFSLNSVGEGDVQITSVNLMDGDAVTVIAIPFMQNATNPSKFTHILIALIRQSRFVKAFSESDVVTSFLVDRHGKVLAHPESELVSSHENFSDLEIVKRMLEGKFNNGQTRYVDPRSGEAKLGAYRMVGFGGLGVAAEVAEAKAFEAAHKVEYRAGLVAWVILCISFLAGYLYSGTITWPIKRLAEAAKRISEGDFKVELKAKGRDEIANLSLTFNEMAKGLEERDRVKETFNKFHNKEIAEKLLSGEVKLGGERKEATVFFSDVRGFTALSEAMQPEEVVEMLNEYMTRMVAIIRSYGGVVDKYVGDAIMALWGVPITGTDDAYNAVRACLGMREELAKLNEIRMSRGQPVLKIGMGLNTGTLIAGNIGSNEKMEYTVIGDAVNLASRIESMTKEYGTDLLISSSVYSQVNHRFVCETGGSTKVKGKTDAIVVYKIRGYLNEQGQEVLVETPYSSYAAEKSDKVVHDGPDDSHGHTEIMEPMHSAIDTTTTSVQSQRPRAARVAPPKPGPARPASTNARTQSTQVPSQSSQTSSMDITSTIIGGTPSTFSLEPIESSGDPNPTTTAQTHSLGTLALTSMALEAIDSEPPQNTSFALEPIDMGTAATTHTSFALEPMETSAPVNSESNQEPFDSGKTLALDLTALEPSTSTAMAIEPIDSNQPTSAAITFENIDTRKPQTTTPAISLEPIETATSPNIALASPPTDVDTFTNTGITAQPIALEPVDITAFTTVTTVETKESKDADSSQKTPPPFSKKPR